MNKKLAVFLMLAAFGLVQMAPVAAQTNPTAPAQTPPKTPAQTTPKKNTTPKKTTAKKKTSKKSAKPAAKPKTGSLGNAQALA